MDKKSLTVGLVVVLLIVLYYLISPIWKVKKLNENLPGQMASTTSVIKDKFDILTEEEKALMESKVSEMKDQVTQRKELMPEIGEVTVVSKAPMVARAHSVSGDALILKYGDQYYLRLENLKTINGPDLKVYLSADLSDDDFIDLGPIRATEGSANYVIPLGRDITKYKNVLIWCRAFSVLFSYAEFK
jgi:ABC-type multidrug transport system fused ATPase/permease subunit